MVLDIKLVSKTLVIVMGDKGGQVNSSLIRELLLVHINI